MNGLIRLFFAFALLTATTSVFSSQISYTDNGQGQAIVLIHAFPTNQHLWQPQIDGLKNHFRVITLDLYGFGDAATVDGNAVTMTEYADEVHQLLDQLHIQKAIIGGESMGGYVALAYLKKYPQNTQALILSDTQSISDSADTKAAREKSAVDVLTHGSEQYIQNFAPKALSKMASAKARDDLQIILQAAKPEAIASALRGMALREDTSDVLANTDLPVLILTGDLDSLISPQQSERMHTLAKNSQLVYITDAGHLSNLEQPEEWNAAVEKFLDHA